MKNFQITLNALGCFIALPFAAGMFWRFVEMGYKNESSEWCYVAILLFAAAWIVGKISDRKNKDTV